MLTDVGGIPVVQSGSNCGDGFGGSGIWAVLLLALLGGRGCGGYGGYGGYGGCDGYRGGYGGCDCNKFMELMENNNINSRFDSLQQTIDHNEECDFQREIEMQVANGFGNANLVSCQGFGSVNANIAEAKFAGLLESCKTQAQIADCCRQELRADDQIRFEAQQNKCEIMKNNDCNTQKILDKLACSEIQELRDKLQNEKFQNSQLMQNTFLVNNLRPYPTPSYISCNPQSPCAPYGSPYGAPYGYGVPFNGYGFKNDCDCCGRI